MCNIYVCACICNILNKVVINIVVTDNFGSISPNKQKKSYNILPNYNIFF